MEDGCLGVWGSAGFDGCLLLVLQGAGLLLRGFLHGLQLMENMIISGLLAGSWDLVSMVISTLSGVIRNYKYSYLNYNPSY